jgi:hypothetical protein
MKKHKIYFWIFTSLIVVLDGVIPALTSNSELARQGISHLGFPDYFRVMLTIFKVSGALILILPIFQNRIKEWAYAGFTFNFVCAAVSLWIVDGFSVQILFPLIALLLLALSYYHYHALNKEMFSHTLTA